MRDKDSELLIDEEEGLATAEALNFFNDLFDSVNGSDKVHKEDNDLRHAVSDNSMHHSFWTNAKIVLRGMNYIDKVSYEIVKKVPTLTNWTFTVDGFQKLWNILHTKFDFHKLNTRYCNQDPLENFFGQIRSHAVRHINPTPSQFQESFITLLVSNMKSISIVGGNCEAADDSFMLLSLEECLKVDTSNVEVHGVARNDDIDDDEAHDLLSDNNVEDNTVASFSDYSLLMINSILKEINNCSECDLCFKSSEFSVCTKQIVNRVFKLLKTRSHRRNIAQVLIASFEEWDIDMSWHECIEHSNNEILDIMVRVIVTKSIIWWCNEKNNILKDANIETLKRDVKADIMQIKRMRASYKEDKCKRKEILKAYKESVRNRFKK